MADFGAKSRKMAATQKFLAVKVANFLIVLCFVRPKDHTKICKITIFSSEKGCRFCHERLFGEQKAAK
jgi:hypothetical protein